MAEFPDENGRSSCLEEMEEDIYVSWKAMISHSNKHLQHIPVLHYHHIFLITGGVIYQHGRYLFMKFFLYYWQGNYYEAIVRNLRASLVSTVQV